MAAAASSTPPLFYRLTHLSNSNHKPLSYPYSNNLLLCPFLPHLSTASKKRSGSGSGSGSGFVVAVNCLGVDGGGVSDDSLSSTTSFCREFSVIGNMLKKIEPLDVSVISKGASASVKDSMKHMISSMLGLLPSDQLSVTIRVSKRPLVRLVASSLITGYTLWNAEYRIMLMKNFETCSTDVQNRLSLGDCNDAVKKQSEELEKVCDNCEELERLNIQSCLADLSPDALNYIQELEAEISAAKKELHAQKHETMQIGYGRESNNNILKYLRSLDSEMLNELSRPSSSEVKGILQQLVQCTSRRVFKEDIISSLMADSEVLQENYKNEDVNFCETRDYLSKLLFWCMLLGHQLRGLENRLYLRHVVGAL